jgi:hypothetical protein
MKKLVTLLALLATTLVSYGQTCPTPTTSGVFVTLDASYQLAASTVGFTNVELCFHNNTPTLITATQFRVYYDKFWFEFFLILFHTLYEFCIVWNADMEYFVLFLRSMHTFKWVVFVRF